MQKRAAITMLLTRLALHYWRPDFTPAQAALVYADYVRELEPYPMKAIQESIAAFQRSPDARFFPAIGELLTPLTTRPAWDVGSNQAYRGDLLREAAKEINEKAAQIARAAPVRQIENASTR